MLACLELDLEPSRPEPIVATPASCLGARTLDYPLSLSPIQVNPGIWDFQGASPLLARLACSPPDIDSALEAIQGWSESPASTDVDRLAMHPDDRVPLALVGAASQISWRLVPYDKLRSIRLLLYLRAVEGARQAGAAWTLLLDRLADSALWPVSGGVLVLDDERYDVVVQPPSAFLPRLRSWIVSTTAPANLHPLLQFRSPLVRLVLADAVRVLDHVLFDALSSHSDSTIALAHNTATSGPWAIALIESLIDHLRRAPHLAESFLNALIQLHRRDHGPSAVQLERILEILGPDRITQHRPLLRELSQFTLFSPIHDRIANVTGRQEVMSRCR